ncbi:MAG: T9SS type A sorting domain-containing protein [Melioribacteraceae bacterium]|nr:T9SS type A sorting domain-containing protein [Melioribacteraceae bacterium]
MKIKLLLIKLILILINFLFSNINSQTIQPPTGVKAIGYESHIDVVWDFSTDPNIGGYKVYRFNGTSYELVKKTTKYESFFMDWIGQTGIQNKYKVSAYDFNERESNLSSEVSAITHTMTDEEFLDMTQRATFRYFYDYGHPTSGLARERYGSGETCTIGGTGFGIMSIISGIERGFITRKQGVDRIFKIVNFLKNSADKFHGVFPHWMNGTTGKTIPFSQYDDGADLIETAFLIQGLLAARQYFDRNDSFELIIRSFITDIWEGVEWSWFTQGSNYLYWHWSPNYSFRMNMRIQGPNEGMIAYLLAIASPTYKISPTSYYNGWTNTSYYVNGKSFYGYKLWVGWDYGGPLFFAHYSFLGFDPRNKKDKYCNYFDNNKNHTLIHRAYAIANPKKFLDYGENVWGFTASDDPNGYDVHEPNKDNGTISPTAALSSMPYTPKESIEFLKNIYRKYGNKVFGDYGFKDAFNPTKNWFANSYLAIDQGPIMVMIENYRSQTLWKKFMANPEIQPMLNAIGFTSDPTNNLDEINIPSEFNLLQNYPNPFNPTTNIEFTVPRKTDVEIKVYDLLGREVAQLVNEEKNAGVHKIIFDAGKLSSGIYFYEMKAGNYSNRKKIIFIK